MGLVCSRNVPLTNEKVQVWFRREGDCRRRGHWESCCYWENSLVLDNGAATGRAADKCTRQFLEFFHGIIPHSKSMRHKHTEMSRTQRTQSSIQAGLRSRVHVLSNVLKY